MNKMKKHEVRQDVLLSARSLTGGIALDTRMGFKSIDERISNHAEKKTQGRKR